MNKLQTLIRGLGFEKANEFLKNELHISIREYDNYAVYNYNQIFSPDTDPYVIESRGITIAKDGTILARAWDRFFNYSQHPEITGKFEFDDETKVVLKEDGSLVKVWFNPLNNLWQIATRGTAHAEGEHVFYPSFKDAILEDGFGLTEEEFQRETLQELRVPYTYVFEYCSNKNRIVTRYESGKMVLLDVILNDTGESRKELRGMDVLNLSPKVSIVEEYKFPNMEAVLEFVDNMKDLTEGFVLTDKNGLKIKIKSSLYSKVHRLRGDNTLTPKRIASLVVDNEHSEYLSYFPEDSKLFEEYINSFTKLILDMNTTWENVNNIENQKEFALVVKDLPYSAIMFSLKKTKKSIEELFSETRDEYRINLLLEYMGK